MVNRVPQEIDEMHSSFDSDTVCTTKFVCVVTACCNNVLFNVTCIKQYM